MRRWRSRRRRIKPFYFRVQSETPHANKASLRGVAVRGAGRVVAKHRGVARGRPSWGGGLTAVEVSPCVSKQTITNYLSIERTEIGRI